MENAKVPIFFAHGDNDDYVPCSMSEENHAACAAPKMLLKVPGAGHGLAYIADPEGYIEALRKMQPLYEEKA